MATPPLIIQDNVICKPKQTTYFLIYERIAECSVNADIPVYMSVLTKYSLSELLEPVIIKKRTFKTTLLLKPVISATSDCALKVW